MGNGILRPDDLHFFYYDIGLNDLERTPIIYTLDDKIRTFLDSKGITLDPQRNSRNTILPRYIEKDKMSFLYNTNETAEEAFFRHLRNAFAHYRISRNGDYFEMMDINPRNAEKVTMIGNVNCENLKEIYFLFKDQSVKYEESLKNK